MDRRRFLPAYHYANSTDGFIYDNVGKPLRDYKIYGNSIQQQGTGKNLIPFPYYTKDGIISAGITFSVRKDFGINCYGTANGYAYFYLMYQSPLSNYGVEGEKLTFSLNKDHLRSMQGQVIVTKDGVNAISKTFADNYTLDITSDIADHTITFLIVRVYNTSMSGTCYPMMEKGSTVTAYEPPIVMPSIQQPSEIISFGEKTANLYDRDNGDNLIIGYSDSTKYQVSSTTRSVYIRCKPNTKYTVSKIQTARFSVSYTSEYPMQNTPILYLSSNSGVTKITTTSPANAKYLIVYLYHSSYDTNVALEEILDSLQIQEGDQQTVLEPYGYKVPIKFTRKNIFDMDYFIGLCNTNSPGLSYNVKYEMFDGRKCIYVCGSTPYQIKYPTQSHFKENTQYTISFDFYDVPSGASKGMYIYVFYSDGTRVDIFAGIRVAEVWSHFTWTSAKGKTIDRLQYSYGTGSAYTYFTNFQIEEGAVETEYEPFGGSQITIGKNLFDILDIAYCPSSTYKIRQNNVTFTPNSTVAYRSYISFYMSNIKFDETYTVSCNIDFDSNSGAKPMLRFGYHRSDGSFAYLKNKTMATAGRYNLTFTTPKIKPTDMEVNGKFVILINYTTVDATSVVDLTISNIQLEKGSIETEYEVFRKEVLPVCIYNLDEVNVTQSATWAYASVQKLFLEPGEYCIHTKYIQTGTNTTVAISLRDIDDLYYNFSELRSTNVSGTLYTRFTVPKWSRGVNILLYSNATSTVLESSVTFTELMVLRGYYDVAALPVYGEWSDKIDNTISILLKEPLRKVGDYADYIDYKNSCIVRNTQRVVLDSSVNCTIVDFMVKIDCLSDPGTNLQGLCTHSTVTTSMMSGYIQLGNNDTVATWILSQSDLRIIAKDIDTFKTWLDSQTTPVEIVCERTTPFIEPIELPTIPTSKGTVNITIDTDVQPSGMVWQYYRK